MKQVFKVIICSCLIMLLFNHPLESKEKGGRAKGYDKKKKADAPKETYRSNRFNKARDLAEKKGMPIVVTWSAGNDKSMFFKDSVYGSKFVWVHLNTVTDKATLKKLGKDRYFTYAKGRDNAEHNSHQTSGYIFMNADGVIYSRLPKISNRGIDGMLVGVCRRHYGYDGFYGTSTFNGRPEPKEMPGKIEILPTPKKIHVWKDCDRCKRFLEKAMPYIASKYPGNWYGGMLGSWTCMPALMMYGKHDALLKQHFESRAESYYKNAPTVFSGYMNWFHAGNGLSMSEYALRYGLTPKLQGLMEKTHQDAAEYIDECLSWFHHPRKGGRNYSREIGMIGCLYHAAFAEMDYMGVVVEPGLSLSRAACSRGSYGSVGGPGKNGIVVSGMYPAGRADDPFTHEWAQHQWGGKERVQNHNPKGGIYPQQQHAYGNWQWMGSAVGIHRLGPAHYDKWATEWIHALIQLQNADGGTPILPNDCMAGSKNEPPINYVNFIKKKNGKSNWEGTGVVASMVLMSQPGAFYGVPIKPKGSLPNNEAYKKAEKYFEQKQYANAYTYYAMVLPPGEALHLVPSARVKMRVCEESLCLDLVKRREIALAIARYPAETRADAGVQIYRKIGNQDLVISSINRKKLSPDALLIYALIQKGNYGAGFSKMKEFKAKATEYDKRSFMIIEKYVLADVKIRLERIEVVKRSQDVYQLYNVVAAADKFCKGFTYYENAISEIRTQLALPESQNLKLIGAEFSELIDSSTSIKLLSYLTELDAFMAKNSENLYGTLAHEELLPLKAVIKQLTGEVNDMLKNGNPYAAMKKMRECEKSYRSYWFYEKMAVGFRETLKSKRNLKLIKVGEAYQRLINDKRSLSKPGSYIIKLDTFMKKNEGTYYSSQANDLKKSLLDEIDNVVDRILTRIATGDMYMADRAMRQSMRAYGKNKKFAQKMEGIKATFKTKENRELIAIGNKYYKLIKRDAGGRKAIDVASFLRKYGQTYYGKLLKK
jgi:hypothetical protein